MEARRRRPERARGHSGCSQPERGTIPQIKVGSFDLPKVPAVEDPPHPEQDLGIDLGGVLGSGLLSIFRITFGDEGRFVWLEPDPTMMHEMNEEAGRVPHATMPAPPPPAVVPTTAGSALPAATPPAPPAKGQKP